MLKKLTNTLTQFSYLTLLNPTAITTLPIVMLKTSGEVYVWLQLSLQICVMFCQSSPTHFALN